MFRPLPVILLTGAAILCAGTKAQSADAAKGRGVIVTATRVPTDPSRIASSNTIITAEEIERRQFQSLPEILQAVPGLAVTQSGGIGQQASIFSRGTESNHTLFLINGVEATDPSSTGGIFQFEHILVEDIERVEVVRGPQSVLYGSDAIGAVVNVITRRGAGDPSFRGAVEGGSFGTISGRAGVAGSEGAFDYAFDANRYHTDGISAFSERIGGEEDDAYDNYGATTNLGFTPNEVLTLRGFLKLVDSDTEIDPGTDDPDAHIDILQTFGRAEAELNLLDGLWVPRLGLSATNQDRKSRDFGTEDEFTGTKFKLDLQNDFYVSDQHTLTLGGESEWDRGEADGFSSFDERIQTQAVFAQEQFAFWDRLVGAVGARLDHHSEFGTEVTWRVAPAYLIEETGTKLKASYGTGFKAPNLEDLFGGDGVFVVGNPDLQPEESRGWDAGFEQSLFDDRLAFGSTYFYNKIDNLIAIDFNVLPDQPENVDEAKTWGLESFIAIRPLESVAIRLDHTWLNAEDENTGEDLVRRPRHKLNLDLAYTPIEVVTVSLGILYVGKRDDFDAVTFERIEEDGYTVVSVAGSWQIMENLRLFGRIENLLDEDYENPNGFGQPGIGVFAGLAARL
ncbi:MAG TPA: TonB-dependent receptor [Alphaproteobacteria bacterium]|nr:TonB-dependent receptor [Alphaproteobacteria bacterium]